MCMLIFKIECYNFADQLAMMLLLSSTYNTETSDHLPNLSGFTTINTGDTEEMILGEDRGGPS